METLRAHGKFHAAHRQLHYQGKCAYVHGHTWRGTFVVRADRFPRDPQLDMSVDFGALKDIFSALDHKMLISKNDLQFLDPALFCPEGVVVMPGENPSVENVALYCLDEAVAVLKGLFPGQGVQYYIEVTIQETDNNFYSLDRTVVI
ncbi:MAG: 6-carboxytetrahydropterin synthase [Candidatus Latescibacteria bacterium]|nr:6-carboxytetrahydropterin synthase [Candidatus Latescibacterota bacterium]